MVSKKFHKKQFHDETVFCGTPIFAKISFMKRKQWSPKNDITPSILKFREKRKWQIALRRYVIEKSPSSYYAPFFGLDIKNIRLWFSNQFEAGLGWNDFAKLWQFDHIIPVTFFDFSDEDELKMCWNFTNIRVEHFQLNKERGNRVDVLAAKGYFTDLFNQTGYSPCAKLLEKIHKIEVSEIVSTEKQKSFILENKEYLDMLEGCSAFEFELLNTGRSISEIKKDIAFLRKFDS